MFPCACPGSVVFLAGCVGTYEWSVFAFRSQVHVEFDFWFECGWTLQDRAQVFLYFACEEVGLSVVGAFGWPIDDDHVGVGAEVDFPAAVASHADDGDCGGCLFELHVVDAMPDGPLQ